MLQLSTKNLYENSTLQVQTQVYATNSYYKFTG